MNLREQAIEGDLFKIGHGKRQYRAWKEAVQAECLQGLFIFLTGNVIITYLFEHE